MHECLFLKLLSLLYFHVFLQKVDVDFFMSHAEQSDFDIVLIRNTIIKMEGV